LGLRQVNLDVNVAPNGFGVWTCLVCGFRQGLGNLALQPRQADVEAGLKEESTISQTKVNFRVNGHVSREPDFHFAGGNPHRAFEACRPTSGKQLLGIGAGAWSAGSRMLDIKAAIIAFGGTSVPATRGVDFGGVYHFLELGYDGHGIKIHLFMHCQRPAMNPKIESAPFSPSLRPATESGKWTFK
jgi:hypothetical protein